MIKIGKIIALVILAMIIFAVLAAFAVSRMIDPNDYKNEIQALAHDKANIVLHLDGDIGWRFFPWLGLVLNNASIASAETPDKPLAQVKAIHLAVRLLPLLRKNIQMNEIRIDGLKLTAVRDANGQTNWTGIGGTKHVETAENDNAQPSSDTSSAKLPIKINIGRISVTDTLINYHDMQNNMAYTLDALNMTTGAIQRGKDTPISFSADFDTGRFAWHGKVNLDTTLNADFEKRLFTLSDLSIKGKAQKADGKALPFSVTGAISVGQQAQTLSFAPLLLAIDALRLETRLQMRDRESRPIYEGKLVINETNLRQVLEKMDLLPATASAQALTAFSLNADLDGDQQNLSIKNLRARLDATTINGAFAVADFAKPFITAQISGDTINIDDYLPKTKTAPDKAKSAAASSNATNAPVWSDAPVLPLDILHQTSFNIDAAFDRITAKNIAIEKPVLKAVNKDGLIVMNTLRGATLGGTFSAHATFDARSDYPKFTVQKNIDNVQLEQLFAHDKEQPPIKGKAVINAKLTGSGNSLKSWVETLHGNGNVRIDNGVLPEAHLEMKLCQAIALLNRKPLTKEFDARDTAFQHTSASFSIENGMVQNSDLAIALPGLNVNGQGSVDLRALTVDYRAGITVEGDQTAMPDPACTVNKRYVGLAFPLRCRGPITSGAKICGVDEEGVAKIALKLAGDKVTDKALEKLDEKLGDKAPLKDALKGLLGR